MREADTLPTEPTRHERGVINAEMDFEITETENKNSTYLVCLRYYSKSWTFSLPIYIHTVVLNYGNFPVVRQPIGSTAHLSDSPLVRQSIGPTAH